MIGDDRQAEAKAREAFVTWLDRHVLVAGRGDALDRLDVAPDRTFWLGRLACEEDVLRQNAHDDRSERLDPCAIGIRIRPASGPPWSLTVTVRARAWLKDGTDPEHPWHKSDLVEQTLSATVGSEGAVFGQHQLRGAFSAVGAIDLSTEVRVEVEDWHEATELVVQMVNTSPKRLVDSHIYETQLELGGVPTIPFQLESLPDSFRYDRSVPAYGINVGVEVLANDRFRTSDTITVQTTRSGYWNAPYDPPDLSFETLAKDPLPELGVLVEAVSAYHEAHWSAFALDRRQIDDGWDVNMRAEADIAAGEAFAELDRLRTGLQIMRARDDVSRAFQLMNSAIGLSARGRGYSAWRPFQIGFILSTIRFLVEPDEEADYVDTIWFATGGGKTETYLGLLLTAAFFDRLTGKTMGVTAWSRFPLRLLSLQQTQRFADALAGAETVRRREDVGGRPFALGFLVGDRGTPNKIVPQAENVNDVTPDSPGMPERFRVLLHCPFCRDENLIMKFDRERWILAHVCTNDECNWTALPVYVVDQEIFRFLPTVVVGTLDKAASVGLQQAMRGLVGPPRRLCPMRWHGFTYAPRSKAPNGCLVPGCQGGPVLKPLPMAKGRFPPSLRLQDELHLLRDSLGAVDSHYESLLDHLQNELCGSRPKIIASSATLTGYDRQVDVLYRRRARVFPQPGPRVGESFWSSRTDDPLRRFVAVAPRGVTLEHVSDRTLDALQGAVRDLLANPSAVCAEVGIDRRHADMLVNLYGTNVVYGTTLYDVEAASRSLGNNTTVTGITIEQLTGGTGFDEVRAILERLENPEPAFDDRIHVVAASSMLSHGVDLDRLNTMVMLGLPLTTAEFIQTTARVGRRFPGLVYTLLKIGRERDARTFQHFGPYVRQGDRFVDAIPITRRSRRVLDLTIPGIVAARTLMIREPASERALSTPRTLREYARETGMTPAKEAVAVAELLGFEGEEDALHRDHIRSWLNAWFHDLEDPATRAKFISQVGPRGPMMSLRDVEASAPIHD